MIRTFGSDKQRIGLIGEDLAYEYLVKKGFAILQRNYSTSLGEIDIIGQKDGVLYFVEVKTVFKRHNTLTTTPEDNLSVSKLRKIRKCSEVYISEHNVTCETRFSALLVELSEKDSRKLHAKIRFMRNIIIEDAGEF